jgi:hypothetical protein
LGIEIKVKVGVRFFKPEHKLPGITRISGELPNTGMNPIISPICHLLSYLSPRIPALLLIEQVTNVKPDFNSVEVHPQLS